MIKNIIFDWSGTLSDDFLPVCKATLIVLEKRGVKNVSMDKFREEFELPALNFYRRYLPNIKKEELRKEFIDAIYSIDGPKPFPEAMKFLESLHEKGVKIALLSSHLRKKVEEEIDDYGFAKFFKHVKGSAHDKREEIVGLLDECEFKEEETAFVGDMTHDIESGKKANVTTIAVTWGYEPKEKLEKANPDHIVESFDELKELILKNPKV